VNWLLRKFKIYPNAYYNFLKDRKAASREQKAKTQRKIVEVYHKANGVPGYRMMRNLLVPYGFIYCNATIYKYMQDLRLRSIVRRKRPDYRKGKVNKVFPNLLNQNFNTEEANQVWCTDFTYLYLNDGTTRYNCTIIDLFDRSVVASLNGNHITAELAIETLKIAIRRHKPQKGIILHSDQGTQYTSKEFNHFCEKSFVQQSMSRAGCPYDNAPMERYYNTLKHEFTNLFSFKSEREMDMAVNDFAYGWYNHVRPHTYNRGLTPSMARVA
jgi:transposase InsO family protein